MDFIYSIVGFFVTGGPFMYPILLVFAVGTAISIERFVTLTMVTAKNQSAWSKVQPALMNGDFEQAREMTTNDDSTISQLLSMGLARQGAVRRREDIEIAMEEGPLWADLLCRCKIEMSGYRTLPKTQLQLPILP
jgi:biopolymer transport protein ExbB